MPIIPAALRRKIIELIPTVHIDFTNLEAELGAEKAETANVCRWYSDISAAEAGGVAVSCNSKVPASQKAYFDVAPSVTGDMRGIHDFLVQNMQSNNHTEPKLLVEILAKYPALGPTTKGTIVIVSSRDVCRSCQGIIEHFSGRYTALKIYAVGLQHGNPSGEELIRGLSIVGDPSAQSFLFKGGQKEPVRLS